jgi:hypothetical protein
LKNLQSCLVRTNVLIKITVIDTKISIAKKLPTPPNCLWMIRLHFLILWSFVKSIQHSSYT